MKRAFLTAVLASATAVSAQPVKCVDASGKVRYVDASQAGQEKCRPVESRIEIVPAGPVAPTQRPNTDAVAAQDRLQAAEKRLAEAKQKLSEQETMRNGDERNYQRVLDRLKPYQDAVESAQQDVDQARRDAR